MFQYPINPLAATKGCIESGCLARGITHDFNVTNTSEQKTTVSNALEKQMLDNKNVQEKPFYIVDLNELTQLYHQWQYQLPEVVPFYAIKCHPDPKIIKTLAELGAGFDCASLAELKQVLSLGVSPDRIIFANPCKMPSHLRFAAEKGVLRTTFDSVDELMKIKKYHPKAHLLLRIATDDSDSGSPFSAKFGARMDLVNNLLATSQSLDLKMVGVSFHVGSSCGNANAYKSAIINSRQVFNIAQTFGMKLNVLDLGGGYTGRGDVPGVDFATISETIRNAISNNFYDIDCLEVIAEPGRYFVSTVFTLAARIYSRRLFGSTTKDITNMYYINDGVYGSFNNIYFDHYEPVFNIFRVKESSTICPVLPNNNIDKNYSSCIWGPTCDSIDLVVKSANLPVLQVGDWLVFYDMGAYTTAAGTMFNGCEKPDKYYINH